MGSRVQEDFRNAVTLKRNFPRQVVGYSAKNFDKNIFHHARFRDRVSAVPEPGRFRNRFISALHFLLPLDMLGAGLFPVTASDVMVSLPNHACALPQILFQKPPSTPTPHFGNKAAGMIHTPEAISFDISPSFIYTSLTNHLTNKQKNRCPRWIQRRYMLFDNGLAEGR